MDDLTQKTNEELFALYKKERNPEIRRELTMRYLYIATSVARQMYDIYSSAMQMEDAVNDVLDRVTLAMLAEVSRQRGNPECVL